MSCFLLQEADTGCLSSGVEGEDTGCLSSGVEGEDTGCLSSGVEGEELVFKVSFPGCLVCRL
jgi:hypothetical protein